MANKYNNIDLAYNIPVNRDLQHLTQQLIAQDQQKKLLADHEERAQLARQDQLSKYVGQEFQDKRYMTGTAYDPLINEKLASVRAKYGDMIRKNPNQNLADLDYQMQKDISDIASTASGIKAVRDNVKKQATALAKYQGIDANAAEQLAMSKFLYDVDPKTGKRTPKDPNTLDPTQDYVAAAINDHPELISKGDEGLRSYLKTFQLKQMADVNTFENRGVTRKSKYDLQIPDYMEPIKDAKGNVTGAKVRSEQVAGIKNPDGTPLEVVDKGTYDAFASNPGVAVGLSTKFKEYNNQLKTQIDPNSEQGDILKRKILFDDLNKHAVYKFKQESDITNNSLVDKMQLGIPTYRQGMTDAMKALKEDKKLEGLDPALIMRGLGGERAVLEGADQIERGGKTYFDMSKQLGGFKLGKNPDGTPASASGLLIDPVTKKVVVTTTGEDGKPKEESYTGKGIRKFVKQFAESNGVAYDKASRIVDNFMDADGKYKAKTDNSMAVEIDAKRDLEKLRASKNIEPSADKFSSTGNLADLKPVIGAKTKDGGIILDVKKRNGLKIFSKPFYIEIQNGSETIKKDFQTQEEVAQYIKENTQK